MIFYHIKNSIHLENNKIASTCKIFYNYYSQLIIFNKVKVMNRLLRI